MRAWDRQMVGPGFYQVDNWEERKGDLLLLGNIELRRKLIAYLEGDRQYLAVVKRCTTKNEIIFS